MEEKEVYLSDYLNIIWKKKWIIIIGTILSMIVAGVVSFLIKPIYEIDVIVQPGKFFLKSQDGSFEEYVVEEPRQIADKVKYKSYDAIIAFELNIDRKKFPKIMAEDIKNTLLARMWIKDHDVELSQKILHSLVGYLKEDIDKKIDIEIHNVDVGIKSSEIAKEKSIKEIEILGKKLVIIAQRKKDIIKERESAKNKIEDLEREQSKVLKKEKRSEVESLGMLLYSNEIQQSLRYYDYLNEKLSEKRIEEEDMKSKIQEEKTNINFHNNNIENLKEIKGRIDYTKVIKEPTSSTYPISPKKKLNVLIAGILGLMVFIFVAFFINYIEKNKT